MLTIALIDKHPIARLGLSSILSSSFPDIQILESESVESFFNCFPNTNPDLFILGFDKFTTDTTLDSINLVCSYQPFAKIIIMDEDADSKQIVTYLIANAKGYVSKRNGIREIIDCISLVLSGGKYFDGEVMQLLSNYLPARRNRKILAHSSLLS